MDKWIMPMVFSAIVLIFGIAGAQTCINMSGSNGKSAREHAVKYAQELDLDYKHVSCSEQDSDGDGYVSCTVRNATGLIAIECAGFGLYTGCRLPKVVIPGSRRIDVNDR